ncbi:MAG: hypothetical protein ACLUI3_06640 [Christensenellales bacterium]
MRHIARNANGDVFRAGRAGAGRADEDGVIHITMEVAEESIQKPVIRCDESLYYDMLSAFCKSLRGSDADAAMAWFARLLYAGVDPRLIARRIIAHASEDVGLANPTAMLQAVAASQALEAVGLPEARLSMAQAIIAICESPKSNSVVMALDQSVADAEKGGFGPVPIHLRIRIAPARAAAALNTNIRTISRATGSASTCRRSRGVTPYLRSGQSLAARAPQLRGIIDP